MNLRFSPATVAVIIILSALFGPAQEIASLPDGALLDESWWMRIGEEALRGLASGVLASISVIAAAYGVELRARSAERKAAVTNSDAA